MDDTTIKAMTSTGKDDWETPWDLFNRLNEEFHFTLDPCCTHESAKCEKHFTPVEDGLLQDWGGRLSFAILLIPAGQKAILGKMLGLKSAMRNHESRELWLSPFSRPGRKRRDFTTISWEKLKFGLSVGVSGSWITGSLRVCRFSVQ